ncbi:MAG TPA: serine/threonine protein kinase [Rhodopirellula baltica]|uniref:Probable serine/threonine protein kinase n=1 Tax=Rhodopirellula baltica (strain DSM 10527 / NCIMB 13988 / SH1) TaxID=243090 RepID=Q7UJX4_RHOBA|nr:serine/threonine-protein kinase [Rhodopirellula baltica]CAD77107.1 probable serine/threonine protein kinase [Rhodopirellula baltica SH 1]HBE63722.1 serine/threonine protein kinase [Rhodopirellula baltica]
MNDGENMATFDETNDNGVVAAVKDYMRLLENGKAPSIEDFLAGYASIEEELRPALEGLAMLHGAGSPSEPSTTAVGPDAEFTAKPIGDFQIVGELGRGGMGVVYEAVQLSLGRKVALKVLPFASGLDEVRLQRFRNEAHAAAALHHTNIVPVYAVGSDRGVHYYAMQLIDGRTLADVIDEMRQEAKNGKSNDTRPMRDSISAAPTRSNNTTSMGTSMGRRRHYESAVRMAHEAAIAIEHAHQYGVIHRDIKPGNLLIDGAGKVWVTDFGLAHIESDTNNLTRTGDPMGTLRYASPEQASGNRMILDHRTDVYSFGVTLYELLTLRPAIEGEGFRELLNAVIEVEPPSPMSIAPDLPTELDTIVRKAIAKQPSERYATMKALADDLQCWLDDKPIQAKPPTALERLAKWRRRNSGLVAAAFGMLLIASVALLVTALLVWREQRQTQLALDRETQQRELAEESFQQARAAVDAFSELSESELAYRAGLQDVRRTFLETSLSFYRDFLELRADDPALKSELAKTSARVEAMVEELQLLENIGPLLQLLEESVQKELQIDREKADAITDAVKMLQSERHSLANENPGNLSIENADMTALLESFDSFLKQKLSPQQVERLQQIARQRRLPFTFKSAEVVAALEMTREQRVRIDQIIEETRPSRRGGFEGDRGPRDRDNGRRGPGPDGFEFGMRGRFDGGRFDDGRSPDGNGSRGGRPPEFGRPPEMNGPPEFGGPPGRKGPSGFNGPPHDMWNSDGTRYTVEKILEILTPEQRQKWNELIGEPFVQ